MTTPLTFERADDANLINLAVGQPSPDLIPRAELQRLASNALLQAPDRAFNYGEPQGEQHFRDTLAVFLNSLGQTSSRPDRLFLTAGSSQGLELICERFTRPGDVIFVEDRSYFLALQIFKDHQLNVVGIKTDQDGMDIDALTEALRQSSPRLLYTIPTYANPTGACLSLERRRAIAKLSLTHDFLVLADEAYQYLHFDDSPPPAFSEFLEEGHIVCLGTFSKILAPGLRAGWIETSPSILARLLESGWVNSGGAINQLTSYMVAEWLDTGALGRHLPKLRATLESRQVAMQAALNQHLGDLAAWTPPKGGYFFWLTLNKTQDTLALLPTARAQGVGYQPGSFAGDTSAHGHCLRLSFAAYPPEAIHLGVARLRDTLLATSP